jgi:hypothetical protein
VIVSQIIVFLLFYIIEIFNERCAYSCIHSDNNTWQCRRLGKIYKIYLLLLISFIVIEIQLTEVGGTNFIHIISNGYRELTKIRHLRIIHSIQNHFFHFSKVSVFIKCIVRRRKFLKMWN